MTEDEALTKWCPFAHSRGVSIITDTIDKNTGTYSYGAVHREGGEGINLQCIGSKCMVWHATDREAVPCQPDGDPDFKEAGYCGLAGAP